MSSETFINEIPALGKKIVYVKATSATNSDYITVTGLSSIDGCALMATDGTVGTVTFSTNILVVTNGSTKTWSGLVWGDA